VERNLEDLARDVGQLIAEKKLFLSAFRRMGAGVWLQFYHAETERFTVWDIVLFEISDEGVGLKEIYNPESVKYVVDLNPDREGINGKRLFTFSIQDSTGRISYRIHFSAAAVHRRTLPVYRPKDSG
jgi:hypothetical protein